MVRDAGLAEESRVFLLCWPHTSFPKASLHFLTSSPLRAGPSVCSLQAATGMFFKMPVESFPLPTLFSHLLLFQWRPIRRLSFEILCGQARQTPCFPLASSHVMRQAVLACDPGPCMCCSFMPEQSPGSLTASLASLDLGQHCSSLFSSILLRVLPATSGCLDQRLSLALDCERTCVVLVDR